MVPPSDNELLKARQTPDFLMTVIGTLAYRVVAAVPAPRDLQGAKQAVERVVARGQMRGQMFLLSRAGLRYNESAIAPARRPIAGVVPGRRGLAWR
jgi:hypothetical protein